MKKTISLIAALILPLAAVAQDAWPSRPISFVVPFPPGGPTDLMARLIAQPLSKRLNVPIVVENKAGASGMLGLKAMASAKADGYTIGMITVEITMMHHQKLTELDPTSFTPIALVNLDPAGFQVRADSPYKTMADLVAAYKADPTTFAIAGGGAVGSQDWMKGSLIAKAADQDPKSMRYVALEGGGAVLTALEGGHVQVGSGDAAEMGKHHLAGKVRILAVMSPERLPGELKDIPTAKEQGFDIEWPVWRAFYVGKDVSDADYEWWVNDYDTMSKTPEFYK